MDTIKNLFFICLLLQIVEYSMPGSSYGKYVKFYGGMVMLVLLLNPIVTFLLDGTSMDRIVKDFENKTMVMELKNELSSNNQKTIEKILEPYVDKIKQYVESVVKENCLELYRCTVEFDTDSNSSNFGSIRNIKIIVQSKYDNINYIPDSIRIQMNDIRKSVGDFYNLDSGNIDVTMK